MKRLRLIITISTVILLILMVVGVTILIVNQHLSFLDTLYEVIAFCIGIAGILLSIVSQIDAYRQERIVSHLKKELAEINQESDEQLRADSRMEKQLDEIEEKVTKKPHRRK
jgi:uncharacterized membrane protein (DUF106 family)